MRKFVHAAASAFFLMSASSALFVAPAHAAANPRVQFCRDLLTDPFFANISLGECVSVTTVEDNLFDKGTGNRQAAAVKECLLLPQYAPDFYDTFASNDECIQYFLDNVL